MIHACALRRTFSARSGPVEAVSGIDLDVGPGEIVGFLGPNGAGKTTTLRMLSTLLRPTSGRATVAGHDLLRDRWGVRRAIGYVAQGGTTHPDARAGEEIVDQARLHGLPKARAVPAAAGTLERLGLEGIGDRPCRSLSGGQRRRLDIALGIVHGPRLVFLDEPTTGLDPRARAKLWDHIRDLRGQGTTFVLTTHYLEEADALSDRVVVVDHGRIVASGTPRDLKRQVAGDAVTLVLSERTRAGEALRIAGSLDGASRPTADGGRIRFHVPASSTILPGLLRDLDSGGVDLDGVEVHRPTLDDVFRAFTGRSLHAGPQPDRATSGTSGTSGT